MTNDMTNEEALNLIQHKLDLAVDDALIMTDKEYEVFSLCAKALEKESKTGHWVHNKCDKCGASRPPLFDNYCPNCGTKMIACT